MPTRSAGSSDPSGFDVALPHQGEGAVRPLRIRERMRQQTGTAIREAAIALFAQNGFHGTTMRDIAAAANITSAAIYTHFDDKETLLVSIMEQTLVALDAAVEAAVRDGGTALEKLRLALREHVRFHASNRLQVLIADSELRALSTDSAGRIIARRDSYESKIRSLIVRGIAEGGLREVDPRVMTRSVIAVCTSVHIWFRADGELTADAVADQIAEFAMVGLATHEEGNSIA